MKLFKFKYLVTFTALTLAGCAAYFSVIGLSQLFAGAGTAIIIMASILEASKLVAASLLERYWKIISFGQKVFFSIAVGVLMCITSAGIYGLLSSGYEKTASELGIHDTEVELINAKIENYEKSINSNTEIITTKTDRVKTLTGLRDRQESRLDSLDVKTDWRSRSTANKIRKDIKGANEEIQKLNAEIDGLVVTNGALMDSVGAKKITILEKEATNEAGAELGPLKYLAELTGSEMDTVISYFILAIIIVFDPLAIALVVVANKLAMKNKEDEPKEDDESGVIKEAKLEPNEMSLYVEDGDIKGKYKDSEGVTEEIKFDEKPTVSINGKKLEDWGIKDFEVKGMSEDIAEVHDDVYWGALDSTGENKEEETEEVMVTAYEPDVVEVSQPESEVPFVVTKTQPIINPMDVSAHIAKAVQDSIDENPLPLTSMVEEYKIEKPEPQVVEKPQKDASEILDDKIAEVKEEENKVNEIIKQTLEKKEQPRKGFSVNVPANKKPNAKLAKNNSVKTNSIKTND